MQKKNEQVVQRVSSVIKGNQKSLQCRKAVHVEIRNDTAASSIRLWLCCSAAAIRLGSQAGLPWLSKLRSRLESFFYSFDDVETKSQNAFFYTEVLQALSVPKCTREHLFHSIILIEDNMYFIFRPMVL